MNGKTSFWTKLRNVLLGAAVGAAVCGLLLLLFAALITFMRMLPQAFTVPPALFAAAAGAFSAGACSGMLSRHYGLLYGLADALLLYMILFLCGQAIIGDGVTGFVFVKLGLMLLFGMLGGVLGVNRRLRY